MPPPPPRHWTWVARAVKDHGRASQEDNVRTRENMTIGVLLPRDFLDRQPKRWQKSQRKRGALKTLKKMQEKRAKLEHRTLQDARNDDNARWEETYPAQPKIGSSQALVPAAPARAKPAAAASSCTAFGHREQGFWAAELVPNRPLVVRIPEGAELWLLHAALPEGASAAGGPVLLRCRVPASQAVSTLCGLQPGEQESCRLTTCFSAEDRQCALGVEGEHPLHLIGCYKRAVVVEQPVAAKPPVAAKAAAAAKATTRPAATSQRELQGFKETVTAPKAPAAAAKQAATAASVGVLRELAGGLKVVDTSLGKGMLGKKGRGARNGDQLTVKYVGLSADADGNWVEFDSNQGKPMRFKLGTGEVIRGWDQGIAGMGLGGTRRLIVPPSLGYGDQGAGGKILPGATLVFEITLKNIQ